MEGREQRAESPADEPTSYYAYCCHFEFLFAVGLLYHKNGSSS